MNNTNKIRYIKPIMALAVLISLVGNPGTAKAESTGVVGSLLAFAKETYFLVRGTDVEAAEPVAFPETKDRTPRKTITVVATAYSSDPAQTDNTPCIPASGYDLCKHFEKYGSGDTIAANFLPLGTVVRFPGKYGDKVFIVRDRMNARYGQGRIDIWMASKEEAKQWGVKKIEMEIF